jgi:hypothetical protein
MSYCMCGADDCPRCYPSNFRHGRYVGDMDDEELQDFEDGFDEWKCNEAESIREEEGMGL